MAKRCDNCDFGSYVLSERGEELLCSFNKSEEVTLPSDVCECHT